MEQHRTTGTWRSFDATDGLPGAVNCVVVHPDGHLWLGTSGGLCRFDGVRFTTLTTESGLCHNDISALLLDHAGRLWIGTRGGGVSCLDHGSFTAYGARRGLAHDNVQCMIEDSSHRLWIGTSEGVTCYDGSRFKTYTSVDGLANDSIRCICEDEDGGFWFGTAGGGATYFDGESFSFYTTADGLGGNDIRAICRDARGRIWFGSDLGGAACYDGHTFTPIRVPEGLVGDRVRAITQDHRGWVWFACWESGLTYIDGDRFYSLTTRDGLLENRVQAIAEDGDGNLWFCHPLAGLSQLDPTRFTLITDEPVSETLMRDHEGAVWFGNQTSVCCLRKGELITRSSDSRVYQVLETRTGQFWIATRWEGVYQYSDVDAALAAKGRRFTFKDGVGSDVVMSVLEARDGTIWVGTGYPGSLCRFNGDRFEAIPVPHPSVFRLFEDSAGRIWMGGFEGGGLSCYDGESLTTFTVRDGLPSDRVQSILEDEGGRLWIGTQAGLCYFRDGEFYTAGGEKGIEELFHQTSLRDRNGHLWFGTLMGGLFRSDGEVFQRLTARDGLPSNSITGLAPAPDGGLLIGTYHGVVHYTPSPTAPPGIVVSELVADEAYPSPRYVTLSVSQARLVILSFQGFSLATQRIRYVYMLEGYDPDWHHTWAETVRYEDLPTGAYRFRVRAYNRDLVPSDHEAVVNIEVTADPWEERQAHYEAELGRMAEELAHRQRAERLNAVLVDLAKSKTRGKRDLAAVFGEITEAAGRVLGVEFSGIWVWEKQRQIFRCQDSYQLSKNRHSANQELTAAAYPRFVAGLEQECAIACDNLDDDPRTRELAAGYLRDQGVASGMFAPIRLAGATAGMVQFLHTGSPRTWRLDETQFAGAVADVVSLALDEWQLRRAEEERRLMETQVQRAQKLESLGMLAGGVAHDFNNLLMAIIGNADLAAASLDESAPERKNLQQIQEAGMRAAELTKKMLAFSGRNIEPLETIDLSGLVRDLRDVLLSYVPEPATLEITLAEGVPLILGDATQLEQVVKSLAANAAEAVDPKTGHVSIAIGTMEVDREFFAKTYLSRELLPGSYVFLEVLDNGIGMDARTQTKLFEPFYSTKFIGRGLGLPAVWGIVQGHQGAIRVDSTVGQGTRFTVLFPPSQNR